VRDTYEIRTCRFCGGQAWSHELLKYSTRCYAHFACFYAHKTPGAVEKLPEYQRKKFEAWRADMWARNDLITQGR
jgi:hypothetical protein